MVERIPAAAKLVPMERSVAKRQWDGKLREQQ